jgi:tetratricopeptide (TPR) repeat protein
VNEPGGSRGPGFTRAVHLTRAVTEICERRLEEAEAAIDAAIQLEPDAPEAYWLRSSVHRQRGRYAEAARDWITSLSLDPHFLEAEKLRWAIDRVRSAFLCDPIVDAEWGKPCAGRLYSAELEWLLKGRARSLAERRQVLARPSCSLPCPSQCCYFDEEPFLFIEPSKIGVLRTFLRECNLPETEHIGRASAAEAAERLGDERSSMFLSEEDGERCAHYLRCDERAMPLAYRDRPRRLDVRAVPWVNAASRACRFVSDSGCLLHDVGDPPGLETCRAFLCLTGFVFTVLRHLGAVSPAALAARTIADLHEQAIQLLPLLDDFYAGEEATAHMATMRESLRAAIDADVAVKFDQVSAAIAGYQSAAGMLAGYHERQIGVLRASVG